MLKNFYEFKANIINCHEKKHGFGIIAIKLPASITIKPVKKQLPSIKDDMKTENFEVIQISDSDSGENTQFANDFLELIDDEPKSPVQNKIKTRTKRPEVAKSVALCQFRTLQSKWSEMSLTEVSTFGPQIRPTNKLGASTRVIVTCDLCNHETYKGYFANHFHVAHSAPRALLTCDVCPRRFKKRDRLISHQNFKHPNRGEFVCTNCYSKFSSIEMMKTHQRNFRCYKRSTVRSFKTPPVKVVCPDCGKLLERGKLNLHISRKHNNEKRFQCSVNWLIF